ncbi:unnamed protein product [Haemonchus placei]|uniref:Big_5 domain-containing protein n=1 Tax=Haemonchus placei TaxID=6290 RepID=A0A0N4WL72_HAEPC|nr:unnamed protein product [Haemonchus placei]
MAKTNILDSTKTDILGIYTGPPSEEVSITIPELVLTSSPTNLEAKVITGQILIEFVPVPEEEFKMFGENKGCKITLCKVKEITQTCLSRRAPAQSRSVEFIDFDEYGLTDALFIFILFSYKTCSGK